MIKPIIESRQAAYRRASRKARGIVSSTVDHRALRIAEVEYSRTVSASMCSSMSTVGRRVLTTEHVELAASIQGHRRGTLSASGLIERAKECARTRELWT